MTDPEPTKVESTPPPGADTATGDTTSSGGRGIGCLGTSLIIIGTMVLTLIVAAVVLRLFLFPPPFEPVELDATEQQVLEHKLASIGARGDRRLPPAGDRFAARPGELDAQGRLEPETYREKDAPREVSFDERELNAIIARDPAMARRLAIDLSEDLVSVKLLLPLPPDFPIMGGQTLRLTAGAEVRQVPTADGSRLAVIITGVSLWGVPLPNAWLGGLKGVDLVAEFGDQPGFWQSLADGVESVQIEEGRLVFRLAE